MRLKLCQVVKVDFAILLYSLEYDDPASSIAHAQKFSVLIERQRRKQILLRYIRRVWLS